MDKYEQLYLHLFIKLLELTEEYRPMPEYRNVVEKLDAIIDKFVNLYGDILFLNGD